MDSRRQYPVTPDHRRRSLWLGLAVGAVVQAVLPWALARAAGTSDDRDVQDCHEPDGTRRTGGRTPAAPAR